MKNIVKLGAILFLITAIAGGVLAFANEMTKSKIDELALQASNEARKEVFAEAENFEAVEEDTLKELTASDEGVLEVHEALDASGELVGYVMKTVTKEGYGGSIEIITGVTAEGEISGIKVGTNSETPGLGTNAATPEFQDQFKGKTAEAGVGVSKSSPGENEIQALTGATITSNAVANGVNKALEAYKTLAK